MIEPIMYSAIGFLVSMLFGLMILPLVHNRAVRLTTKRLEAATPLSMAEIQADKDQLRADFAMSARRLEMAVDQLKSKTISQSAEIGKKTDAINRLKLELDEKTAAMSLLEGREKVAREQLAKTEQEFTAKTEQLATTSAALAEKQAELAGLTAELADRSMTADTRKVELVTVHTQIDTLKARMQDAEKEFAATQARLTQHRKESETASVELTDSRTRADGLNERVADLDRQLSLQVGEAEQLSGHIAELEGKLAAQTKLLAERDGEATRFRQLHEAAQRTIAELRQSTVTPNDLPVAVAAARSDASPGNQSDVREAYEERDRLRHELDAAQQAAQSSWANERTENALLRERITDVAAEVAKLAITLEGPNSPLEAILTNKPDEDARTQPANGNASTSVPGGTLADRIRALQSHAARIQTSA